MTPGRECKVQKREKQEKRKRILLKVKCIYVGEIWKRSFWFSGRKESEFSKSGGDVKVGLKSICGAPGRIETRLAEAFHTEEI